MDAISVLSGALGAIIGSCITHYFTSGRERRKTLRDEVSKAAIAFRDAALEISLKIKLFGATRTLPADVNRGLAELPERTTRKISCVSTELDILGHPPETEMSLKFTKMVAETCQQLMQGKLKDEEVDARTAALHNLMQAIFQKLHDYVKRKSGSPTARLSAYAKASRDFFLDPFKPFGRCCGNK